MAVTRTTTSPLVIANQTDWRKVPCPKCGRKGLHWPMHPHALGYKDHTAVECRFCHARFKVEW
jgi:hypothetical protein